MTQFHRFLRQPLLLLLIFVQLWAFPVIASVNTPDSVVVVVAKNSPLNQLSTQDIEYIYSGKITILKNGIKPVPLDIRNNTQLRQDFYGRLLNVSMEKFDAFWARLLFTGHATPPRLMASEQSVLDTVAHNALTMGFAYRRDVDNRQLQIIAELH